MFLSRFVSFYIWSTSDPSQTWETEKFFFNGRTKKPQAQKQSHHKHQHKGSKRESEDFLVVQQ